MRCLVITTRNRYLERLLRRQGEPSPPPSRVAYPTALTERETVIELARRFSHRRPRRIPGGLSFEGDAGDVQEVRVEDRPY